MIIDLPIEILEVILEKVDVGDSDNISAFFASWASCLSLRQALAKHPCSVELQGQWLPGNLACEFSSLTCMRFTLWLHSYSQMLTDHQLTPIHAWLTARPQVHARHDCHQIQTNKFFTGNRLGQQGRTISLKAPFRRRVSARSLFERSSSFLRCIRSLLFDSPEIPRKAGANVRSKGRNKRKIASLPNLASLSTLACPYGRRIGVFLHA